MIALDIIMAGSRVEKFLLFKSVSVNIG